MNLEKPKTTYNVKRQPYQGVKTVVQLGKDEEF
jgi:hypothetical protein